MEATLPPDCLGRYRPERLLAQGGFGRVYLARQIALDRLVVVKVLRQDVAVDPDAIHRFIREAKISASLSHPGIVQVLDFDLKDGAPWIAFEFVPGETLRSRVQRGPVPPREAAGLVVQVCQALDAAHARGILHRDIKPENILETPDGRLKLADFGIARWSGATSFQTQPGLLFGTPVYMSPEQLRGEELGPGTDIYSVGILFHELLSGTPPFQDENPQVLIERHLRMSPPTLTDVPRGLQAILSSALAKRVQDRPASAGELASSLERFLLASPAPVRARDRSAAIDSPRAAPAAVETMRATLPPERSRRPAVGLVILIASLGAGWSWRSPGGHELSPGGSVRPAPVTGSPSAPGPMTPRPERISTLPPRERSRVGWILRESTRRRLVDLILQDARLCGLSRESVGAEERRLMEELVSLFRRLKSDLGRSIDRADAKDRGRLHEDIDAMRRLVNDYDGRLECMLTVLDETWSRGEIAGWECHLGAWKLLWHRHDARAGEKRLLQALAERPEEPILMRALALTRASMDRRDEGTLELVEGTRKSPWADRDEELMRIRAQTLESLGRPEKEVVDAYLVAIACSSTTETREQLATFLRQRGRVRESLEHFEAIRRDVPHHWRASLACGELQAELGMLPDAGALFQEALARGGEECVIREAMARSLAMGQRWEEAEAAYLRAHTACEGDARRKLLLAGARLHLEAGRREFGRKLADLGLSHFGDDEELRALMTDVLSESGETTRARDLAKDSYRRTSALWALEKLALMASQEPAVGPELDWLEEECRGSADRRSARLALARSLEVLGREPRAAALLQGAARTDQEVFQHHERVGVQLFERRQFDKARLHLEKAYHMDPSHEGVLLHLGNSYQELGQPAKALPVFTQLVRRFPEQYWGLVGLGNAHLALKDPGPALEHGEKAMGLLPESLSAHLLRAMALSQLDQPDRLARACEETYEKLKSPEVLEILGDDRLRRHRWEEARSIAGRILGVDPVDLGGRRLHADALRGAGLLDRALEEYRWLQGRDATNSSHWMKEIEILRDQGRLEETLMACDKCLTLHEGADWAHRMKGEALLALGRNEQARSHLEMAVQLAPRDAGAWRSVALVRHRLGSLDDAEEAVRISLELEADHAQGWVILGNILEERHGPEAALPSYREAYRLDPGADWTRTSLENAQKSGARRGASPGPGSRD